MQVIHTDGAGFYTLSFARGDEVMTGLVGFCQENSVKAAHITGLGAAGSVTLAYYNLETKTYEKKTIVEDVEVLSLVGNVGVKEGGELVVHLHGTFGRRDLNMFGGHVVELTISGAGEVHLRAFDGAINRKYDDETGLTLMCQA